MAAYHLSTGATDTRGNDRVRGCYRIGVRQGTYQAASSDASSGRQRAAIAATRRGVMTCPIVPSGTLLTSGAPRPRRGAFGWSYRALAETPEGRDPAAAQDRVATRVEGAAGDARDRLTDAQTVGSDRRERVTSLGGTADSGLRTFASHLRRTDGKDHP